MKLKRLPIICASALFIFSPLNHANDLELLNGDFVIGYEAEAQANITANSNLTQKKNSQFTNESYISLNAEWKGKIRAVLTAKIESLFEEDEISFNNDFDIGEFISEAFIEIKQIAGRPVAVIIGKQPIAFGQNAHFMPIFTNNPLFEIQQKDEVFGLTVDLQEGLFGLFDQAELSVFETKGEDLELGKIDGMSIKLTKELTDNIIATASHIELGNDHLNTGHERRSSIGLITQSNDGKLIGWFEGLYLSNNPEYMNAEFGVTTGVLVKVHDTTDIILEYSYIQKNLHQVALGSRTALTKNLTLGFEVRYNSFLDGRDDEVILGTNLTYAIDSKGDLSNDYYIFGSKDNDE